MKNLGQLMRPSVRATPGKVALVELGPDGHAVPGRSLSYAELDLRLDRIAAAAVDAGLNSGDRVAIALSNRLEFATSVFGLMRAGIVPAILNPRLSADDYRFLLEDAGARGVIVDSASAAQMAMADPATPVRLSVDTELPGFAAFDAFAAEPGTPGFATSPESPAMVLYTSGSTGRPKGVISSHHGQFEHFTDQIPYYHRVYRTPPVALVATPMFHKNGTGALKTSFAMGGTLAMLPRFDPRTMLHAIAQNRVTTFSAVAPMLMAMLQERDLLETLDLSSLEAIMAGAAPTGRVLLDEVERVFGARVYHMFGATECGAVMGHDPDERHSLDSCGRPLPGVSVRLVAENGEETAEEGELWVRSPGLALGYRNRPDEEARRFRAGWYGTGDILRRDPTGFYYFRGRIDDMFVCGGENIYPLEVERVLLQIPAVHSACVVPVPHPTKGQAPAAAVVVDSAGATEDSIRADYLARGPAYANPRLVLLTDSLPIAPTGKVDRASVSRMLLAEASRRTLAA